jgi:hypothetical protein
MSMPEGLPANTEESGGRPSTCPKREYALEHKMWIVLKGLEMQPLFDNKLHKN